MLTNLFQWIRGIGREALSADPGDLLVTQTPNGGEALTSLDAYAERPLRRKSKLVFSDLAGFVAYVAKYREPDSIVLHRDGAAASAILDYITPDDPEGSMQGRETSWYDHRAEMPLNFSVAFNRWTSSIGKSFSQTDFAAWIDERPEIVRPNGSDLLTMVIDLQDARSATFASKVNRANGTSSFQYTIEGGASGAVKIPDRFTIRTFVYTCSPEPRDVDLHLRYRISAEGKLSFSYDCPLLDAILEAENDLILDALRKRLPSNIAVLRGSQV